jgi:hypothetical protein
MSAPIVMHALAVGVEGDVKLSEIESCPVD